MPGDYNIVIETSQVDILGYGSKFDRHLSDLGVKTPHDVVSDNAPAHCDETLFSVST